MELKPDKQKLIELAHYRMPFGKYKGWYLMDLPEALFDLVSGKRDFLMENWENYCDLC